MAARPDQVARVVIIAQALDYDCSRLPAIAFLPVLAALATLTHRLSPPGDPHLPPGRIRPDTPTAGPRTRACSALRR
jgi:hypothetical protein